MAPRSTSRRSETPIGELVAALTVEELREVVSAAVDRHDDVERQVRLVAARAPGDLAQLRAEVDRGLRTRRFLGYRESMEWARAARPIVAELEAAVRTSPSTELVELLQRAVGHVVKVILHADDSSGLIGDVARELLIVHALACDAGVADPVKLAAWMIRFRFVDQDFFEVDPVRYASALGEDGIAAYRQAVAAHPGGDSFAARYARERLAVLDGDLDAIVKLLGGDLSTPYRFVRVAEAMAELGRDDETLAWTARGIAETHGWQTAKLYDLACAVHAKRGHPLEVLALRRAQHERMPSRSTYGTLRTAADAMAAWPLERDAARAALQRTDLARSSTPSSATAKAVSPGTQPQPLRATRSGLTFGCVSPKVVRPKGPPTRWPCTNGSLTKCSKGPTGGRTRRPCEYSSALERRRRVRAR